MQTVLHILTKPADALAQEIIAKQKQAADKKIEVADLTSKDPDYKALVEKIFAADSVQVW